MISIASLLNLLVNKKILYLTIYTISNILFVGSNYQFCFTGFFSLALIFSFKFFENDKKTKIYSIFSSMISYFYTTN